MCILLINKASYIILISLLGLQVIAGGCPSGYRDSPLADTREECREWCFGSCTDYEFSLSRSPKCCLKESGFSNLEESSHSLQSTRIRFNTTYIVVIIVVVVILISIGVAVFLACRRRRIPRQPAGVAGPAHTPGGTKIVYHPPPQQPTTATYSPAYNQQPAPYPNQHPTYLNQPPTYPNQPPTYPNQPPTYPNQPPTYPNQPPTYPNQPPAYPNQPPAYPNQDISPPKQDAPVSKQPPYNPSHSG